MAKKATLSAPYSLDPRQADDIRIDFANIDFNGREVAIGYRLYASGSLLGREVKIVSSGPVQTWIDNQEQTIYERLLANLGISGSIG